MINQAIKSHWSLAYRSRTKRSVQRAIAVTPQTIAAMWRASSYRIKRDIDLRVKRRENELFYNKLDEVQKLHEMRQRARELRDRKSTKTSQIN